MHIILIYVIFGYGKLFSTRSYSKVNNLEIISLPQSISESTRQPIATLRQSEMSANI